MKEFVSSRRVIIVTTVASLLVLWAIVAIPGGPTWPAFVSGSVLLVLLVATTKVVLGSPSPAPMSEVIRGVEGEKAAAPAVVTAGYVTARQAISWRRSK